MKQANDMMRKRLDAITESRLASGLAGLSVRPRIPPKVETFTANTRPHLEVRRQSDDAAWEARRVQGSEPIQSPPLHPHSVPKVGLL